jgi:hypothetical protein
MPLTVRATQTARTVRSARPLVVFLSILSYLWVTAGIVVFAVDIIRWVGGRGQAVTGKEVLILVIGMLLASATPLVLWVRYLRQQVWRNTPRCLRLKDTLRAGLAASVLTYGVLAFAIVLVEGSVLRLPLGQSKGGWDGLAILPALLVGVAAARLRAMRSAPP